MQKGVCRPCSAGPQRRGQATAQQQESSSSSHAAEIQTGLEVLGAEGNRLVFCSLLKMARVSWGLTLGGADV